MVKVIVTRPGYIFGRVQKVGAELRIKSTGEFSHRWMEPADDGARAALAKAGVDFEKQTLPKEHRPLVAVKPEPAKV